MKKSIILFIATTSLIFSDVKIKDKTSLNGLELGIKINISLNDCIELCETTKTCVGLNYRHNTKRCGLLKSYSSRLKFNGNTSGIKYSNYKRERIKIIKKEIPKKENKFISSIDSGLVSIGTFFSSSYSNVKDSVSSIFSNKIDKPSNNNIYDSTEIIGDIDSSNKTIINNSSIEKETISTIKEENINSSENINIIPVKKSFNSIVKDFSNSPIKIRLKCKLYKAKSNKLILSNVCEMRKYLFDDHTKMSINFINGHPFFFIKNNDGNLIYLNLQEKEVAYYSESKTGGEFIFDIYRLTYEK